MGLSESILPEFDHEMANTRKTLERVPHDKSDWKPHEKSMGMGDLATHLGNIPTWVNYTIDQDSLDLAPGGEPLPSAEPPKSQEELLATFDSNTAKARAAIAGVSDAELFKPWTLMSNGNTILTMPKIAVLRSFVMNHLIHHRAQLGVYLRLNDIPVPSIYGPSADENPFG
ncbi:MAG: DinB family protein [Pyrinomonadaceae bacterium]|nr:DinB family protein [Pyrinomonadaceae bacterium]